MNQKEWKTSGKFNGKYKWYNQTRKLQRSLCYESDPNANIIHHLRDTEEQRNYNDTHYEYWGFNEDGTFEYGKYVVFWTKEHHDSYHAESEETHSKVCAGVQRAYENGLRQKRVEQMTGKGNHQYGKRGPLSTCYGRCGELHPMYGKCHTEGSLNKIQGTMNILKNEYHKYKSNGGILKWQQFMKALSLYKKETNTNSRTVNYSAFIESLNK